jgi:hypothetical protein
MQVKLKLKKNLDVGPNECIWFQKSVCSPFPSPVPSPLVYEPFSNPSGHTVSDVLKVT